MRIFGLFSLAIFVISSATFAVLYFKRGEIYAFTEITPASISEIYPISDRAVTFSSFETLPNGRLAMKLKNADDCRKWELTTSFDDKTTTLTSPLVLQLKKGTHEYALRPLDCQLVSPNVEAIRMQMYYGSAEDFGPMNLSTDQFQINRSNISTSMHTRSAIADWVPDYSVNINNAQDAKEAWALLESAGYDPNAPTLEKIAFLTKLVRKTMKRGTPPAYINTVSPWSVIKEIHTKQRNGNFCRQWSLGYGYLANLIGIPTRNLFTGGAIANVDMNSHAYSESYSEEHGRWMMVDPTSHIAYFLSPSGLPLNAAEIYMASTSGNVDAILARSVKDGDDKLVSFLEAYGGEIPNFVHKDNFVIYVSKLDSLYQFQESFLKRNTRKLIRFLFHPKQYFGHTQFTSYYWLRPVSFFTMIVSAMLAGLGLIMALLRNTPHKTQR